MDLKTGDIILFGGSNGLMGKLIRHFDDAEYTHIGIVLFIEDIPFVLDMWTKGIELVPLSKRIAVYPKQCVLRIDKSSEKENFIANVLYDDLYKYHIKHILNDWYFDTHIRYDYFLLLRIAIAKKLRIDFMGIGSRKRRICSELVQEYANMLCDDYKEMELITPQDFIRYNKSFTILNR